MEVKFYDFIQDSLLKFAVIVSRYNGKWVLCKHKNRDTYEVPGGRREEDEAIRQAAMRELYEETGAVEYDLKPVSVYSVSENTGENQVVEETFGMLYFAEIKKFEPELHYEIEEVVLLDKLPDSEDFWTYPLIQPELIRKIMHMGYVIDKEELLDYVRIHLDETGGNLSQNPKQRFRKRYEHTLRVVQWAELLSKDMELNHNLLIVAAIFHDIGYEAGDNENHAQRSGELFKKYALAKQWESSFVERAYDLILRHSRKDLMGDDIPVELVLLMEADLMDEEGAMHIVRDCMATGADNPESYMDAYRHMLEHNKQVPNPMVTEKARRIWRKKKNLENDFIEEIKRDLFII